MSTNEYSKIQDLTCVLEVGIYDTRRKPFYQFII